MRKKFKIRKKHIFYIAIFIIAVFFRAKNWGNYPFGFDQVQILDASEKILNGHLTLIGPKTGPASMFTGPLIYYINVIFFKFTHSIYALQLTTLFIEILTGIFILILLKRYVKNTYFQKVYFSLWALSPYIISLDRITWNPNLIFFASVLCFLPLLNLSERKTDIKDYLFIFLGSVLSYQAHFSGLILILVTSLAIFYKSKKLFLTSIPIAGFLVSIIPTIIFDFRHNFVNFRGLLEMFSNNNLYKHSFFIKLFHNFYITIENAGKMFFWGNKPELIIFTGLLLVGMYSYFAIKEKSKKYDLIFLWLIFIAIIYSFYNGQTPEYYYIIQFPALLFLISTILTKSNNNKYLILLTIYFSLINKNFITNKDNGLNVKNQLKVANLIKNQKFETLTYDTDNVNTDGLKYLLKDLHDTPHNNTNIHIIYPYNDNGKATWSIKNIGIWKDTRDNKKFNYLETSNFIIQSPKNILIYRDYYQNKKSKTENSYIVRKDGQRIGWLYFYHDKSQSPYDLYDQETSKGWVKHDNHYELLIGKKLFVFTLIKGNVVDFDINTIRIP